MKFLTTIKLSFILILTLVTLGVGLFLLPQNTWAAERHSIADKNPLAFGNSDQAKSQQNLIPTLQITNSTYSSATVLLEDVGGLPTPLLSAYANTPNNLEVYLGSFDILKEGNTYYLWLNSRTQTGSLYNFTSNEQRFESNDGLTWRNRTNTNLTRSGYYQWTSGMSVAKTNNLYEAWEEYFYEWSWGWGISLRYITSTNGITWTIVNQPALVGIESHSTVKVDNTYHLWGLLHGDSSFHANRSLRHRISASGGTGWGDWQTGGTLVQVDGNKEVGSSQIRRLANGTYQLFYQEGTQIKLATGTDGTNFTTQNANFIDILNVLPITDLSEFIDFSVITIGSEDWVYFTYCLKRYANGQCSDSRMAVSRPIYRAELALAKTVTPDVIHPGDTITYTLTFSNTGPEAASGVVLTDILPSALTNPVINSNVAITDTGSLPRYVWQIQDLPVGSKGIITITGKVSSTWPSGVNFSNVATISSTAVESNTLNNTATVTTTVTNPPNLSCNDPLYTSPITLAGQYYGQAIPLLEELGGSTAELLPAFAVVTNTTQNKFGAFKILKEGNTYYLWIGSSVRQNGAVASPSGVEQRFESRNGLVWCNRANTNLSISGSYRYVWGLRDIVKTGSLYEGWDEYYYEWSAGWGLATRYVTSTNGISWTVVNQPALIGSHFINVVKEGSTYKMWQNPAADTRYYNDNWSLRYRNSNTPGSGWGDWLNGATLITVDGATIMNTGALPNRIRRLADGTYQLLYLDRAHIHLATSTNGLTFATQVSNLLSISQTLPITNIGLLDFDVTDVNGEDWFYLTYCVEWGAIDCNNSHIAVARPTKTADLALTKTVTPDVVHPGDTLTYTLTFSNTGPDTASGVVLTDILPSALENAAVSSNISITDTGHIPAYIWRVSDLPAGTKGIITITAKVKSNVIISTPPPLNELINTATITSTIAETDTSNNTASAESIITEATSPASSSIYLPTIFAKWPTASFPIHLGDAIKTRPAKSRGEIFYSRTVNIPDQLPLGGTFYFSSQPGTQTKVLVDDKMVVLLDGVEVFSYHFSHSGSPEASTLKIPRSIMEQIAGKTVTVQYHDVYGVFVEASTMWLIWMP